MLAEYVIDTVIFGIIVRICGFETGAVWD